MSQFILQEIDKQKLPKRATNILEKFDPYITLMNQRATKPEKIPVFPKDYKILAEKLREDGQDIEERAYRGYRLVKYAE